MEREVENQTDIVAGKSVDSGAEGQFPTCGLIPRPRAWDGLLESALLTTLPALADVKVVLLERQGSKKRYCDTSSVWLEVVLLMVWCACICLPACLILSKFLPLKQCLFESLGRGTVFVSQASITKYHKAGGLKQPKLAV